MHFPLICDLKVDTYQILQNSQTVKNLPAMQQSRVGALGGKIPWRRKWQPTPEFLPGESHEQRSLVAYSPWGHKESDTPECMHTHACAHTHTLNGSKSKREEKTSRATKARKELMERKSMEGHPWKRGSVPAEEGGGSTKWMESAEVPAPWLVQGLQQAGILSERWEPLWVSGDAEDVHVPQQVLLKPGREMRPLQESTLAAEAPRSWAGWQWASLKVSWHVRVGLGRERDLRAPTQTGVWVCDV